MKKLGKNFYNRDASIVAKDLLGKVIVHEYGNHKLSGIIVEAEAYMGIRDKAAHSYNGKRTPRVESMYGKPGISYVFIIYGMHNCFNVVVSEAGDPQAVLIRAIEPFEGLDAMAENRFKSSYDSLSKNRKISLTNGPGKLCKAFAIDRSFNNEDLCGDKLYITEGSNESFSIITSKRIGIDYAEEAKDFPLRFYIENNPYVSVK